MTNLSENNGIITCINLCNLSVKIMHTEILMNTCSENIRKDITLIEEMKGLTLIVLRIYLPK